jgi:hypothetical protein
VLVYRLEICINGGIKSAVSAITSTIESIELTEDALEEIVNISPAQ